LFSAATIMIRTDREGKGQPALRIPRR
jgi:hypothetical protein